MIDAVPTTEPGAPDHIIAEALGIKAAPVGARIAAFMIDALVWAILVSPAAVGAWLGLTAGFTLWPLVLVISGQVLGSLFCLAQLILHGRRGVTLGKAAMRLRSVSLPGLAAPGFWRIVLRALLLSLSNIVPLAGPVLMFASSYWDVSGRRRSVLDRAASCWLIDVRGGLDPNDENALRKARRNYAEQFRDTSERLPVLSSSGVGPRLAVDNRRSSASVIGGRAFSGEREDQRA